MVGTTVGDGRYILKRLIGTGGTADVYEADDTRLHHTVAVKMLHRRLLEDEVLSARLEAEVQISRTLAHRGIVEVLDYAFDNSAGLAQEGGAYLVMEYMAGGDLRKRLLSINRLPGQEVSRIANELLGALRAAHERGVVHRDLKPRNVLFSAEGEAKIADFGLARSVTAAGLFESGTIAGTPEYTAPETVTSSLWDPRSDLYALGCTLYEAAVGSPPFIANTPAEVLRMQVEADPPPLPTEFTNGYPHLSQLVMLLLRKDPNDRPQTTAEAQGILSEGSFRAMHAAPTDPCPSCGAPLSRHYGWCFTCGRPNLPVRHDRTGYTVLVTGPGKSGEKASPEFRDACADVAAAAGLDPAGMRKRVPRLPFVLAGEVDFGGAVRLSDELRLVGAEVALVGEGETGKATLFRRIARKALTMTPRVYIVFVSMGMATWVNVLRSAPPLALLIGLGTILAAVPVVLTASFSRALAKWRGETGGDGGENVTRLLATSRDPLIHARMKSMAEAAYSLASDAISDPSLDSAECESVRQWAQEIVDRTAGLCTGLDAARSGRLYAHLTLAPPSEDGAAADPHAAARDSQMAATVLRDMDALYTRTLELIGKSALDVRELSLRLARVQGSRATLELKHLAQIVARFGDEGEAWREIRDLEGGHE